MRRKAKYRKTLVWAHRIEVVLCDPSPGLGESKRPGEVGTSLVAVRVSSLGMQLDLCRAETPDRTTRALTSCLWPWSGVFKRPSLLVRIGCLCSRSAARTQITGHDARQDSLFACPCRDDHPQILLLRQKMSWAI